MLKSPRGISPTFPCSPPVSELFHAGDALLWGGFVGTQRVTSHIPWLSWVCVCLSAAYGGWLQPERFQLLGKRL